MHTLLECNLGYRVIQPAEHGNMLGVSRRNAKQYALYALLHLNHCHHFLEFSFGHSHIDTEFVNVLTATGPGNVLKLSVGAAINEGGNSCTQSSLEFQATARIVSQYHTRKKVKCQKIS